MKLSGWRRVAICLLCTHVCMLKAIYPFASQPSYQHFLVWSLSVKFNSIQHEEEDEGSERKGN